MAWDLFGDNWLTGICCVWPFSRETIPNGWQEMDGTNGTPDWRGKMVRGSPAGIPPGGTGGAATHTHVVFDDTGIESQSHDHDYETDTDEPHSGAVNYEWIEGDTEEYDFHTHFVSDVTDDASNTHTHVVNSVSAPASSYPPRVDGIWIMKM